MPNKTNIKIWNCVIAIRDGLYKQCKFRFTIQIPDIYPSIPPIVTFESEIYHPLVDKNTGKMDLGKRFESWTPGKDLIVNVLYYIKNIFYNPSCLTEKDSYNPESSKLFIEDYNLFKEKISNLCKVSNKNENTEEENNHMLEFKKLFLEKLSKEQQIPNLNNDEKINQLKKWIEEYFNKVIIK
jgi:ubiquitin-protein ligase